jgi:3-oxoadipate enol-lactonase
MLGPSLGTSATLWSTVCDLLPTNLTPHPFDLPGHGAQPAANGPLTMSGLADAVIEFADGLGIDRFHYAGVSIAGALGLQLGITYPSRLATLSVVCSAATFADAADWHERAAQVRAQGTPVLVDSSAQRWFADGFLSRDPESGGRMLNDLAAADDESYACLCEILADFDATANLGQIVVPTLVITGAEDMVATPSKGRHVAENVQHGRYVELSDTAHLAPIEQPQAVTNSLVDFWEGRS